MLAIFAVATTGLVSGMAMPMSPSAARPGPTLSPSPNVLPTSLTHVIIVMEENHDLSWTLTDPTFKSLYANNAHATHLYATCHPSAPNYVAITSATIHQCGSDAMAYYSDSNVAGDLVAHGLSWQGLFESMPSACDRSDSYPYISHHNPWVYYSGLKATCGAHDVGFFTSTGTSRLQGELSGGTLPALTFVSPNMLHDAHDASLSAASSWLAKYVLNPVHGSTVYSKTTVVMVLFDEAYKQSCKCSENGGYTVGGVTVSGGPIYLVAVSPISASTDVVTSNASFFNVVTTVEWLLGIPSLGHHDTSTFPALQGMFN